MSQTHRPVVFTLERPVADNDPGYRAGQLYVSSARKRAAVFLHLWSDGQIVFLAPGQALHLVEGDGPTIRELTTGVTATQSTIKLDAPETFAYVAERDGKISVEMEQVDSR